MMTQDIAPSKNKLNKNKFSASGIELHSEADFEGMRKAGQLAASCLDMITEHVQIGVTTEEINTLCHDFIIKHNAIPAPLNYKGFPKSICTSINEVICHGIPEDRALKDGDIMNIDVTVILDGWHGDTSRMFTVGKPKVIAQRLCDVTYDCLMAGIEAVKPGAKLSDIGAAIQEIAHKNRFSVVRDFCGHGLGRTFHAPPSVVHFYDKRDDNVILEPGMFFTIEPMINRKGYEVLMKEDGWTAVTRGANNPSAQFEHSLAVTDDGFEIFTLSPKGHTKPPYA